MFVRQSSVFTLMLCELRLMSLTSASIRHPKMHSSSSKVIIHTLDFIFWVRLIFFTPLLLHLLHPILFFHLFLLLFILLLLSSSGNHPSLVALLPPPSSLLPYLSSSSSFSLSYSPTA